jgi:hypothetical protein
MTNQRPTETGQSLDRTGGEATAYAEVMRKQGMATPAALRDSMNSALAAATQNDGAAQEGAVSADDLLRAAENLLDRIFATECENRDSALDLLTVDALVTRAMEVATRDPESPAEFAELAMKRIAAK